MSGKPTEKVIRTEHSEDYDGNEFLRQDVIDRGYAKTGKIVNTSPDKEEEVIERVAYSDDDFTYDETEEEVYDENGRTVDDEEITQTSVNENLSQEEVSLNKKVQAKIAKSQSKTITDMYCFILLASVKYFCKYDENKVLELDARKELSASQVIGNLPLIQHLKNGNKIISDLEIDDDAREAIQEALEIYMMAMNIQTSPGLNLAMAMATPAIGLFMEGMQHKKEMKNLVNIALETQQVHIAENKKLVAQNQQAQILQENLQTELESANSVAEQQRREIEELRKKVESSGMNMKEKPARGLVMTGEKTASTPAKKKPSKLPIN